MKPLFYALSALVLNLSFSPKVFAATDADSNLVEPAAACDEFHVRHGAFHFQRHFLNNGTCFLSADPFDVNNFKYRAYLISNEGILMVFNSYSASEASSATGARVFHFFPRKNTPELVDNGQESILKFAAPQIEMVLSQDKTQILRMTGATVKEDPKVQPGNKGGVEISNVKTLYLDSGFALGHDVTGDPNKYSTFYDINKKSCAVQNKEIFAYTSDGDTSIRFSDADLKTFLKSRCPRLSVNF